MQLHGVVTGTILRFDLSYYAIVGRKGMRRIEGRIVSVVNGESIMCVATKQEKMEKKGDKTTDKSEGSSSLFQLKQMKE